MWALVIWGALVGYFDNQADCKFNAINSDAKRWTCVYVQKPLPYTNYVREHPARGEYNHPAQGE